MKLFCSVFFGFCIFTLLLMIISFVLIQSTELAGLVADQFGPIAGLVTFFCSVLTFILGTSVFSYVFHKYIDKNILD